MEKAWKSGFSAYGSRRNLQKATKLSLNQIDSFLQGKNSYTKFFIPQRNSYPRLTTLAFDINDIWCIDVAYMDKIARPNDGVKFLLVCVDVLSRFLRVEPMKSLTSVAAKNALVTMLNNSSTLHPNKIWTDQGKEFEGDFKKFCKSVGIHQYHSFSGTKAAFAERAIRALKAQIVRHLEEEWMWRYIDKLPKFVQTINDRVNRSIGMAPSKVEKKHVLKLIAMKQRSTLSKEKVPRYKVGDFVRIASRNVPFRKGYLQQFTNEVFTIAKLFSTHPPAYILRDEQNEEIQGKFYEAELIKVVASKQQKTL